jgi:fatty acid desaturase
MRDISGLGIIQQIATLIYVSRKPSGSKDPAYSGNTSGIWIRLSFYTALLAIVTLSGGWKLFLMYWIFPLASWAKWFFYVRALSEHHALDRDRALARTRTVVLPWWSQPLLAPHNINYHLEHHLFPNIPHYNLKRLHECLMQNKGFQEHAIIAQSYREVFYNAFEFVSNNEAPSSSESPALITAELPEAQ